MRRTLAATAAAIGLVLGVTVIPAAAAPAPCPGPITTDYKVRTDLTCTLTITAPDVTVDFKGHTLDGTVIVNAPGVTLRKGTFLNGRILAHPGGATLDRVEVRNGLPFTVQLGPHSLITRSRFIDNLRTAVDLFWGGDTRVERSVFTGNGTGILNGSDDGSIIERNRFSGNGLGVSIWDEDAWLSCPQCAFSNDVVVRNNTFRGDGGIKVRSRGGQTKRFLLLDNTIVDSSGPGILISADCRVVGPGNPPRCGLDDSRVEGNVIRRGAADGILVTGEAIAVAAHEVTLTGNRTDKNAGLGINAPGVVDGGGNRARKNGDPAQCVGVVCR